MYHDKAAEANLFPTPPTLPFAPNLWGPLLEAYLDQATDDQVVAASEAGLELWPYLLNRQGRLAPTWSGASSTRRIYARTPPVQGLPKAMRRVVQEPGRVIIAADWKGSHLHVLAKGSGDLALKADLEADPYAWHPGDRARVKVATLAAINGAGGPRLSEVLGAGDGAGDAFLGALRSRWPVAWAFLEGLRAEADGPDGTVMADGTALKVPSPHQAPAYWLQAVEAGALRRVVTRRPPEGLELVLALHDETVWLSSPDTLERDIAWVRKAMSTEAPALVAWGSSWGDLGDGKAGPPRPVATAAIVHAASRALREGRPWTEHTFGIGLMSAVEPDKLSTSIAVLETQGTEGKVTGRALRAVGKAGKRAHARAQTMVAAASREEVEASDLPLFRKGDQLELGQHLARAIAPPGQAVHTQEGTRLYDPSVGAWALLDPHDLENAALEYGRAFVATAKGGPAPVHLSATAIGGIAKVARLELHDPKWKADTGALSFANGTLTDDGVLHEHDPANKVLAEHVFDGEYDPQAKAPVWLDFLDGVFRDDDDRFEKIRFLREYLGACLFGKATKYQRHPMLWGPSASNGKSVFVKTVRLMFPKGALASTPPQAWSSTFGKAALLHARMNLITETPDREIVDSGAVKAIMTGDPVEVNRKYQEPLTAELMAGHIFAANALPRVTDRSEGFFRRFAMVRFNRVFVAGVDADTTLPERLREEVPGIMAWAVEGYLALKERGDYLLPLSHVEAINAWKVESSSEAAYIQSEVLPPTDPTKAVLSQMVYDRYRAWCGDNGLFAVSKNKLGRALKAAGFQATRGAGGQRAYGLTLRSAGKAPAVRP